jgi:hypothetical protein
MRWGVVVAAVMLMVMPAGAVAKPVGSVPSGVALKRLGLTVVWPVVQPSAVAAAGGKLTVAVVRERRARVAVDVDFTRVSVNGRPIEKLQRKRFTSGGALKVMVPKTLGRHYALTLRAGRLSYRTWIEVPTPAPPTPLASCAVPGTAVATFALDHTVLHVGDPFTYTIANTGTACLTTGEGYTFALQTDSGWQTIPNPQVFTAEAIIIKPGQSWTGRGAVQPDLQPGHYRVTKIVDAPGAPGIPVTTEVDVAAG